VAPSSPAGEPPRIKLYGLVRVTRRAYLLQLAAAAVLLTGLLALSLCLPQSPPPAANDRPLATRVVVALLWNLPWVVLALAALFALEATIVLSRFHRLVTERRAGAPESHPPT
jgi:hypothetical protein